MNDIVVYITCGENEELRYAIRTWCKNLNFNKLYVVGGPKPKWLEPDYYVERPLTQDKMRQSFYNVKTAMSDERLSEDVILLMDDVFVMRKVGDWNINYNRGTLQEHYDRMIARDGKTAYNCQIEKTKQYLSDVELFSAPLSFEEHAPFLCNRKKMLEVLEKVEQHDIERLLYRSIYGNINQVKTDFKLDVKVSLSSAKPPTSELVISTGGGAFYGATGNMIKDWFPFPSRFEKS